MLSTIDSIINIVNSNCLISMGLGILLSCIVFLLSTPIHELGHWIVTLRYCKPLNYSCSIKLFSLSKDFKPHTESDYYTYLENNRHNKDIQHIIRKIVIAGYVASFTFLITLFIMSLVLFFTLKYDFFLFLSLFTFCFICFDIPKYRHSSDRQIFKEPFNFNYKYK